MEASAYFGLKIETTLNIYRLFDFNFDFFDRYIKNVRKLIKPKKLIGKKHLVNPDHQEVIYSAIDIPIETGIQVVKLFAEEFMFNNRGDYIGVIKAKSRNLSYEDIDEYSSNIYKTLEQCLLNTYKYEYIYYYVSKAENYVVNRDEAIIVGFHILAEPIDLF